MIPFIEISRKFTLIYSDSKQISGCSVWGEIQGGNTKEQEETFQDNCIFTLLILGTASQGYTNVKTYQVVHFKQVYFTVCQLYLNKAV